MNLYLRSMWSYNVSMTTLGGGLADRKTTCPQNVLSVFTSALTSGQALKCILMTGVNVATVKMTF